MKKLWRSLGGSEGKVVARIALGDQVVEVVDLRSIVDVRQPVGRDGEREADGDADLQFFIVDHVTLARPKELLIRNLFYLCVKNNLNFKFRLFT